MSGDLQMIPLIKPVMGKEEALAAGRPIESGWVTQGPEVRAFEEEFASYVGASHACAVSNCTAALHLSLLVAGVQPGDEVITVSHTFIATANSIRFCQAVPVFVDVEPGTFNIDVSLVEAAITEKTRAILCVHQMGMPCDLNSLLPLAKKHNLPVIEDAACAIGSEVSWKGEWQKIGRPHGDIACFSFHPRKIMTTGDGGMITTNRSDWDERLRSLRHNGMGVSDEVRHSSNQVIFEPYPEKGFNYRMTDIQAAVGREQLKRLPDIVNKRRQLAARYHELLSGIKDLKVPDEPQWARSNWQSYCVRLPKAVNQKMVMQQMLDQGVSTRRGIMCIHREPSYSNESWLTDKTGYLTESEKAQDECVILPLYTQMTNEDQGRVIESLRSACEAVNYG